MGTSLEDMFATMAAPGIHAIWDTTGYVHLALAPLAAAALAKPGERVVVLSSEELPHRFAGMQNVAVVSPADWSGRTMRSALHDGDSRTLIVETLNAAGPPAALVASMNAMRVLLLIATPESIHERWVPAPPLHRVPEELGRRADTLVTLTAIDSLHRSGQHNGQRQPFVASCWAPVSDYRGSTTMWFGNDLTITSTAED